jgi:hypothetical protein
MRLCNPMNSMLTAIRTAASVVLSMVYDTPALLSEEDPNITRINDFADRLVNAAYPGAYLVEYFTWMKYLPSWMAKWKRDVLEQYSIDDAMFRGLFNEVSNRVVSLIPVIRVEQLNDG